MFLFCFLLLLLCRVIPFHFVSLQVLPRSSIFAFSLCAASLIFSPSHFSISLRSPSVSLSPDRPHSLVLPLSWSPLCNHHFHKAPDPRAGEVTCSWGTPSSSVLNPILLKSVLFRDTGPLIKGEGGTGGGSQEGGGVC